MHPRPIATLLLLVALATLGGCIFVSKRDRRHPDHHRHQHCHRHGGKQVCHDHPHGPGHH